MVQPLNPKDSVVLIVEDNRDDALVMSKALEAFGIRKTLHADTAEGALAILAKRPCDVALVDYNLPGMNGLRLLEHISGVSPKTRVIVVTGLRNEQLAVSAMKLGAADYITKDELLTSGIIRSLQAALREQAASGEKERQKALSTGQHKLEAASAEADWLLETLLAGSQPHHRQGTGDQEYGDEGWFEVREAFSRYLAESFRRFPAPATDAEQALFHKLAKRDASPQFVLLVYRACLASELVNGSEPPFHPLNCLVRVLALLVQEYQRRLSLEAIEQARE